MSAEDEWYDEDSYDEEALDISYVVVDIPSEIRLGEWWQWGYFETVEEAVTALREAGIPVTDDGYLCLLSKIEGE